MDARHMEEIASIIVRVLESTKPAAAADGRPSKIQFETPDDVRSECRRRARQLLDAHPLYPELPSPVLREALARVAVPQA
jgi:glycine hydroxymethyltransferase